MSEPLSTNEIEDVVSSVRRLVSPEARPRPMSRDLGMDRLILTPSFRIVAEQVPSGPTIVKLEPVPKKAKAGARKARGGKAASAGAVEAVTAGSAVMAGLAGEASAQGFGKPGASLAEMALRAEEAEVVAGDESAKPTVASMKARKPSVKSKDKMSAEVESAVAPVPGEPTGKASKTVSKAKIGTAEKALAKVATSPSVAAPVAPKAARSAPKPAKAKPVVAPLADKQGNAGKSRAVVEEPTLVDTALVAAVSDPAVLPPVTIDGLADGAEVSVAAGVADPVGLAPAADAFPELSEDSTDTGLTAVESGSVLTDPNGNTISLLDEEALVLLLRRLIREELQGVLGEKITRNVRKLVRAEVARSLTEQTLD